MNAPFFPPADVTAIERTYELIDNSRFDWHLRTRQGLPFELRFCAEGQPTHFYATRDAALAVAYRWVETGRAS
jgi:hypothetical protein